MQTEAPVYRQLVLALAAAMACVLAACGADQVAGIEGSGAPVASAVTTTGVITGFGSVIVDGVEYATSGAQIRVDDQPATESELRVGHVITIKGRVDAGGSTGTADEITFISNARGAVSAVDIANGTFNVLGQTVRITDETLFDEGTQAQGLAELQAGAPVRVSGFVNAEDELVASRIDPAAPSGELQVRGKVRSLDATARSFRVKQLVVDYRGATISGTLAEGAVVTVLGTTLSTSGSLVASQVSVSSPNPGASTGQGNVEGAITNFSSSSDFVVDGQRVITNSGTELVLNGMTLALDVIVKVRGTFNASGTLVASKVEARQMTAGLVRGLVESVSTTAGTLTVLGVTASVSSSTSLEDRSNNRKREFRLADIRAGDYVEVRGVSATGGQLKATLVQRDKPENRSYLEGTALNVAAPNFTVLGVSVTTSADTKFLGLGGGAEAAAEFFSQAANRPVNVRGTLSGNTLVADQVRLEKQ